MEKIMLDIFKKVSDPNLISDSIKFSKTIHRYVEYVIIKKGLNVPENEFMINIRPNISLKEYILS